ncbi:hypothetical protein H4219_003062 [Mycoemilia scoparia]|uniref:Transmembrane protein n=1 Tax=Mycoemilia scoparia TaxID=417184 RepID=A0A9W8A597_9FUNG|nr:hypothetical protein H4219_003062 [Mycoemilia scoparia]
MMISISSKLVLVTFICLVALLSVFTTAAPMPQKSRKPSPKPTPPPNPLPGNALAGVIDADVDFRAPTGNIDLNYRPGGGFGAFFGYAN